MVPVGRPISTIWYAHMPRRIVKGLLLALTYLLKSGFSSDWLCGFLELASVPPSL